MSRVIDARYSRRRRDMALLACQGGTWDEKERKTVVNRRRRKCRFKSVDLRPNVQMQRRRSSEQMYCQPSTWDDVPLIFQVAPLGRQRSLYRHIVTKINIDACVHPYSTSRGQIIAVPGANPFPNGQDSRTLQRRVRGLSGRVWTQSSARRTRL